MWDAPSFCLLGRHLQSRGRNFAASLSETCFLSVLGSGDFQVFFPVCCSAVEIVYPDRRCGVSGVYGWGSVRVRLGLVWWTSLELFVRMVPEERTAVLLGYDVEVMMKKSPDNSYPEALLGTGDCLSLIHI